jgi:hypothetical protein
VCYLMTIGFVVAAGLGDFLQLFLKWLNGLPSGEQQLAVGLLVPAIGAMCAGVWFTARTVLTRVALSARSVSPEGWLAQGERFGKVNDNLEGLWTRYFDGRPATWTIHYKAKNGKPLGTKRDVEMFSAEAALASKMLMRSLRYKFRFNWLFKRTHVDRWMNVAASLADPDSGFTMTGSDNGVKNEGGHADRIADMSRLACIKLAAGERPRPSVSRKANFEYSQDA